MKRCVFCLSDNFELLYLIGNCRIIKCAKCGLVHTDYTQNLLDYSKYHRDDQYFQNQELFRNIFKKRYKYLSKLFEKPGKVLEIGSSHGMFLKMFKDNGWEVLGVELSKSADKANDQGIKTIKKRFEDVNFSDKYDLVILNHTLEHMENPFEILKKVNKILIINGYLFLDVPNFDSFSRMFMKSKWPLLLPCEHLFHFTPSTLTSLVKGVGFGNVITKTHSGFFDLDNPIKEVVYSLSHFKKRVFNLFFGIPGSLVATFLNHGTSLFLVAQKL